MKNALIKEFEDRTTKDLNPLPDFRPGDTIRVHYRIEEGTDKKKFRIQLYEGVVIRYKKGTVESSFLVRKIGANGIGVERVFSAISPNISKIDVLAHGIVRRSRLYYLRQLSGKRARIKSRFVGGKKKK